MAHFVRTRANLAAWATGTVVPDTDFESFDSQIYAAVNGDGGGVWAPAAAIEIGGSGLKLTGVNHLVDNGAILAFTNNAILDIGDGATAGQIHLETGSAQLVKSGSQFIAYSGCTFALSAGATVTIAADPSITGNPTYSGTSKSTFATGTEAEFASGSTVDINGTLDVDGPATFDGTTTTFNQSAGTTSFLGSLIINGSPQLTAPLACSGTGRVTNRLYYNASDSDLSKGINDCDLIVNPNGVFSAAHALVLSTTGAQNGDRMKVTNNDATWSLTVGGLALLFAAGSHTSAEFVYSSTAAAWIRIDQTPFSP